jgi:glycosyltransferase involved in cell wall biosynthesis
MTETLGGIAIANLSTTRPLVSIVTPFLDAGRFLVDAIESVIEQTYDNWELVLVDDGSTDESTATARAFAALHGSRVRYVEHAGHANLGLPASRNVGIRLARGPYVALLDADDVWLPEKLERQVGALLANPRAAMWIGPSQYWDSWAGRSSDSPPDFVPSMAAELGVTPDTVVEPPVLALRAYPLGRGSAPCPSALLFKRDVALRVGGFDSSFRGIYGLYEDQTFLIRMYLHAPVYVAGEWLDRHRQHPGSLEATVVRDGHYQRVRAAFLRWLSAAAATEIAANPPVGAALDVALAELGIQDVKLGIRDHPLRVSNS